MSISKNSQNLSLDTKRHSFAHLMAAAVQIYFQELARAQAAKNQKNPDSEKDLNQKNPTFKVQFGVGPVIENGCYYDIKITDGNGQDRTLVAEDLTKIEKKIRDMLKKDLIFEKQEVTLEEAIKIFSQNGQPLKVELLENLRDKGTTSLSEEEKADLEGGVESEQLSSNIKKSGKSSHKTKEEFLTELQNKISTSGYKGKSSKINLEEDVFEAVATVVLVDSDLDNLVQKYKAGDKSLLSNIQKELYGFILTKIYKECEKAENFQANFELDKLVEEINKTTENNLESFNSEGGYTFLSWADYRVTFAIRKYLRSSQESSEIPAITLYRLVDQKSGEVIFEDLCKGPHVEELKEFSNLGFSLDKFSASYWRGDQARDIRMQRIYALVFETETELKEFQTQREEAKKRDHRVLNDTQKYYTISDLVGAGLPLFQPNGMIIRQNIQDYLWQLHKDKGYKRVWTPHIAKEDLYVASGHAAKFGDELFRVTGKTDKFFMKPMNCPHHMQLFADNQFSYRDIPIRYFEHATVYRDEKPGQLSGFTRVRSITQDDGHLFCRVSQIKQEVSTIVGIIREFYDTIGMEASWVSLSVRDMNNLEQYLGENDVWELAEKSLEEAAQANNLNYKRVEGEAAFYGPKLDFMFKDCLGREWQLATIQCDFNLPNRFDLSFTNENGEKERPVVIHRAISGAVERFMGVLIDNFAGRFPFWLSPVQVKILTVNNQPEVLEYVEKIKQILEEIVVMKPLKYNEVRFEIDDRNESLGKKIREGEMQKIPALLIVGPKDIAENQVSVRTQNGEEKVGLESLAGFLEVLK